MTRSLVCLWLFGLAGCASQHQFDVIPYGGSKGVDSGAGAQAGTSNAGGGSAGTTGGASGGAAGGSAGTSSGGSTGGTNTGGTNTGGTSTGGTSTGGTSTGGATGGTGGATGGSGGTIGSGGATGGTTNTGGSAGAPPCNGSGEHLNPATGACYRVFDDTSGSTALTYAAAETACETWGGTLVTIETQAEQDYISLYRSNRDCWIGLSATVPTGPYAWENGASVTYSNWLAGEPSNTAGELCGQLYGNWHHPPSEVGFWNNANCGTATCYYCER